MQKLKVQTTYSICTTFKDYVKCEICRAIIDSMYYKTAI